MKKNLENLSAKYRQGIDLANQAHALLAQYLDGAVAALGGAVEMTGFHQSYEEADEAGVDFDSQFKSVICVADKHGFNHNIYITRLYKNDGAFYINGYDSTDGEWVKGWLVPSTAANYGDLAFFVNSVINPSVTEEEKPENETTGADAVLVGYQLVDGDGNFPSGFGCWDVFRTSEDAEKYRNDCLLDPEEYDIVEEWAAPRDSETYRFHAQIERSFEKGETVWLKGMFSNRFVKVVEPMTNRPLWNKDRVRVTEPGTGNELITDMVEVGNIYQVVKRSVCPKCGSPLYRGHWSEDDASPVCLSCGC